MTSVIRTSSTAGRYIGWEFISVCILPFNLKFQELASPYVLLWWWGVFHMPRCFQGYPWLLDGGSELSYAGNEEARFTVEI